MLDPAIISVAQQGQHSQFLVSAEVKEKKTATLIDMCLVAG
jgi:hypothetical protein